MCNTLRKMPPRKGRTAETEEDGKFVALNEQRVGELEKRADGRKSKPLSKDEAESLDVAEKAKSLGFSMAFRIVSILPAILVLIFLMIFLYDKAWGGYKPEVISPGGEHRFFRCASSEFPQADSSTGESAFFVDLLTIRSAAAKLSAASLYPVSAISCPRIMSTDRKNSRDRGRTPYTKLRLRGDGGRLPGTPSVRPIALRRSRFLASSLAQEEGFVERFRPRN